MNQALSTARVDLEGLPEADQERLAGILDEYLIRMERGIPGSPDELYAQYPELAGPLRDCLASLKLLQGAAVPPGKRPPPASIPDLPSRELGDYRLLREVGRGGMGVVYEAWQISLGRAVALKVLPFAAVLDPKQIARFQNEAQAAAQLQHPNIVPVFAVGCERGVHYYSMALIDGQSLDRTFQPAASPVTNAAIPSTIDFSYSPARLEPAVGNATEPTVTKVPATETMQSLATRNHVRGVVGLLIQAADALHHAHESGVIHRDVKPSNLLVDRQGKLWVTDFGLARCASHANVTVSGDVLGTLRYMSPEQAAGLTHLIDHRTDIYSLGITLFECLTGRAAFDGEARESIVRRIQEEPLPSLRMLNAAVSFDLETIVFKATSKAREERYATAAELADDLRRYLEGQPLLARRPTPVERISKWVARHGGIVTASLAIVLVALLGVTAAMVLLARKQAEADAALVKAQAHFREVQVAVDLLGAEASEDLRDIPGAEQVRRRLLVETLKYYEQFLQYAAHDPSLRVDSARAAFKAGRACEQLGDLGEAIRLYQRSNELFTQFPANGQEVGHRAELALCQGQLGAALARSGELVQGEAFLTAALELQQHLAAADPAHPDLHRELAGSRINLGMMLADQGRIESAASQYRAVLQMGAQAGEYRVVAWHNLSGVLADRDPREAERLAAEAVVGHRRLAADRNAGPRARADLALALANLGSLQNRNGKAELAVGNLREAIQLQRRLTEEAPRMVEYRADLAASRNNLGQAIQELGEYTAAETELREAQREFTTLARESPSQVEHSANLANVLNNLGLLLERQERTREALDVLELAVTTQRLTVARAPTVVRYQTWLQQHEANYKRVKDRLREPVREQIRRSPDRLTSLMMETNRSRRDERT